MTMKVKSSRYLSIVLLFLMILVCCVRIFLLVKANPPIQYVYHEIQQSVEVNDHHYQLHHIHQLDQQEIVALKEEYPVFFSDEAYHYYLAMELEVDQLSKLKYSGYSLLINHRAYVDGPLPFLLESNKGVKLIYPILKDYVKKEEATELIIAFPEDTIINQEHHAFKTQFTFTDVE